jgi:hypothetical protein
VLADVVDEEGSDGAAVVRRGDGSVSLLAGGIPDLGFDGLGVDLDGSGFGLFGSKENGLIKNVVD